MEVEGHKIARKVFAGSLLALALLLARVGISQAIGTPNPQAHPQVVPHPQPDPEESPEPPEPPDPPESAQVFVLNDGAVHLGVTLGDVTAEKAQELKLPAVAGAIVNTVQKNSAAAKAGIEPGDAIMEFDGVRVRSSAELRRLIHETPSGRTVEIKVVRNGNARVLSAKLEATANHYSYNYNFNVPEVHIPPINVPEIHIPPMDFSGFEGHRATLGISADDLTPQLAQFFGVKQGKGVLVFEVTKGGPAEKAGLKAGDVIVQVDGKPICGVDELRSQLNDNFTGDMRKVSLTIVRDHHEQNVSADLTRMQLPDKHTSSLAMPAFDQRLAETHAQARQQRELAKQQRELANQQRVQASQLRIDAERQRAMVQAEVLKQQQSLRTEWQRQLRDQMLSFKDHLKEVQNLQVAQRQCVEI